MKKSLLACVATVTMFCSHAQWKTIYEGGYGTSVNLRYDCNPNFTFSADPASNQNIISFNITEDQNRIGMNAYLSPFNDQCELTAGIYKFLPEMGHYASLRVYLDLNLPDSVGTVHYAKLMDTVLNHPTTGAPMWTDFATDIHSSPIYFSNFEGDQTIYMYTDFDVSPGTVFYNYLRVEADTTQVLGIPDLQQSGFTVFSYGKTLHIQASQSDADYEVQLVDVSGKCIYRDKKSGQQELPLDYPSGIYTLVLTGNDTKYQKKIYLE